MSSCSLAQFNLSSVCLRYLPLSFLLPLSHVLSLFISFSPALCLRNYESVSRQATYSQDTFQFDINNKQRATPVPSTPSSPKYLKKTTYSLPSSLSLALYSVCLALSVVVAIQTQWRFGTSVLQFLCILKVRAGNLAPTIYLVSGNLLKMFISFVPAPCVCVSVCVFVCLK